MVPDVGSGSPRRKYLKKLETDNIVARFGPHPEFETVSSDTPPTGLSVPDLPFGIGVAIEADIFRALSAVLGLHILSLICSGCSGGRLRLADTRQR